MKNRSLAGDYLERCGKRLRAVELLFELEDWPDTVRESQEIVELCLKALLRLCRVEPPKFHDASQILEAHAVQLSEQFRQVLPKVAAISRRLRRDRELAFYGSEDLTPSEFYKREDAAEALEAARFVLRAVAEEVARQGPELSR